MEGKNGVKQNPYMTAGKNGMKQKPCIRRVKRRETKAIYKKGREKWHKTKAVYEAKGKRA